jgi:RNA polymerase sigma factor (sigma-70 family)
MDDAEARFRALFERAYPALQRYARNRGLTGADAEDLVATTLEIAWRRLSDVPLDDGLPWLYSVARNLYRNERRAKVRKAALFARLRAVARFAESADLATSDAAAVRSALDGLSADDQEILRLVGWDGLSPAQAAIVLGCGPDAARARLHRARNRLAAHLGFDPRHRVRRAAPLRVGGLEDEETVNGA